MPQLTEKQKTIFHDIMIAHSPEALKAKFSKGAKLVEKGFETGGDDGMEVLILGVDMLNNAIPRYKLLKDAERFAEVKHGK